MKKVIMMIVALVMMVGLCSCDLNVHERETITRYTSTGYTVDSYVDGDLVDSYEVTYKD